MLPDFSRPNASEASPAQLAALEQALRDATERAALAERLQALLLAQSDDGLLLIAPDDTLLQANAALGRLLGLKALPAPGQPVSGLLAALEALASPPFRYQQWRAAHRPSRPLASATIPLRDGRVLELEHSLLPGPTLTHPAELLRFRLVLPPAATALEQHELLRHLPAAVALHDLQGRLLGCNQAFALLLQLPPDRLRGQLLAEFVPLAERSRTWPAYLRQFDTHSEARGLLALQPRDGQARQLLYQAHRAEEVGQAPYVLLCALDSTEQAQAAAELKRAKEKAEASARAKETFLANLSHEIRTPMNGVLGMARQLTRTPLDAGQQELLRIIQTSGEHLLFVLNEVLDMTKISSSRLELEQVSFDLRESMQQALHPLAVQAAEKGLVFHTTLLEHSGPLPRVIGDAYRLNQVMINLVSNAIKFTQPPGAISVGGYLLGRTDTHLTAVFRLTDTGIGIAPDKLEYIFEDFAQGDVDTARRYGGTGLGLGIARALVEQMGGTLYVESQQGRGSTFQFSVTLPCAAGPEAAAAALPLDTVALRSRRVLLVEDNNINREVVRLLLHGWGAVVDEAPDGLTALALHAAHDYDVVLMDIQMPGMSGVEATVQMRLHPDAQKAQVPVLALTANAFRSDLDRYLRAGINDCLTKPFKEEEFLRKVLALLHAPTPPLYDLTQVLELADGEMAFVERIVRSFLQHVPPVLQQIQTAAAARQWPQVARLVHHIKPNLIQFGIAGIAQALDLLLNPTEADNEAGTARPQAVQQLVQQVEQVLTALP